MSTAAQLAQKSKIYIAGSSGSAEVITAITVGYPTILAITGHAGVENGDVVTFAGFTGANAADLNGVSAVVKNYATGATNDTFAVDINTVGRAISIDGSNSTATPGTWIQIKEVRSIGKSGGKAGEIDVTDLDSDAKEWRTGLGDSGRIPIEMNDLVSDPGQQALLAAYENSTSVNFKIELTGGSRRTFEGSVPSFDTTPQLNVDGVQTISAEIKISGAVTRS